MLNPVKSTKIYEAVMEQIKVNVKTGELKKGDKLPSERELSEKLQVSRTSVREALKSLSILGLIESKHGEGNFIKKDFEDSLLEPLSIIFLLLGNGNEEILEFRKIVEPECAAIAAQKISKEELDEIYDIMNELNLWSENHKRAELDRKFHYKIAQASGNMLISTIMFSISALIEKYLGSSKIYNNSMEKACAQHRDIYEALKEHDSEKVKRYVKDHLELGEI